MLQSEAGYSNARPHQPDRQNLLHRTAGPYIRVSQRHQTMSAATAAFLGSGRRARATVAPPTIVNQACQWWRNLLQLRTLGPATVVSATGQNRPLALQKRSKEFRPEARCAMFSGARVRGRLLPVLAARRHDRCDGVSSSQVWSAMRHCQLRRARSSWLWRGSVGSEPVAAVHGVAQKRLPMTVFSHSQEVSRA